MDEDDFIGRWEEDGGRPLGILNTTFTLTSPQPLTLEDFLKAVEAVKKMR